MWLQNTSTELVKEIFRQKLTDQYNGDFNEIKNNLNLCIDSINLLIEDANMLVHDAVDGKLASRADTSRHEGDYQKIN
jgi:methyl-accepting chemotaxis protein